VAGVEERGGTMLGPKPVKPSPDMLACGQPALDFPFSWKHGDHESGEDGENALARGE
jgi:hypothetical protein